MKNHLITDLEEVVGTNLDDIFITDNDRITYGLEGDDIFIALPDTDNNVMVGGPGNDAYFLADRAIITIVDNGGYNSLYAPGLGMYNQNSYIMYIEGGHLFAFDTDSGQQVLIAHGFLSGMGVQDIHLIDGVFTQQYIIENASSFTNYLGAWSVADFSAVWWPLPGGTVFMDVVESWLQVLDRETELRQPYLPPEPPPAPQPQPQSGIASGFDAQFYLARNPDVAAAQLDAQWHFDTYGWHEGRDPNPWFDTSWYLATNPDVAGASVNPLDHYWDFGWREGRQPSAEFDGVSYLEHNPDVAAADMNPLEHWLMYGQYEDRAW